MSTASAKLVAALSECSLHAGLLSSALAELPASYSAESVLGISAAQRRALDQLAYRFMKLQDSLGEKVLPGILDRTEDPLPPQAPFAEKLQRLERLGAVADARVWRVLREVRNSLAHEYPDAPALQAAALTRLLRAAGELLAIWSGAQAYLASLG